MRLFEFESLRLIVDNPGGEWLAGKQEQCRQELKNQYGAPGFFGAVTATFNRRVLMPVSLVSHVHGIMGEHGRTREDDLAWLKKEMGENNRLPFGYGGGQYAPFIQVDYKGMPYFSGGEEADGSFHPEKVKKFDSMAMTAGYKPGNDFQGKIAQMH